MGQSRFSSVYSPGKIQVRNFLDHSNIKCTGITFEGSTRKQIYCSNVCLLK